jgi:threonine dehydrogenase-like Zn-dependent dehydrogenase
MRAVSVKPAAAHSAQLGDMPAPEPTDEECLVRVLEVGICGTDREIAIGEDGDAPEGAERLIIGHESIGTVARVGRKAQGVRKGDLVVATVRRPCPELCINCRDGEYDFCLTGNYRERGIKQLHGYLAESYAESPQFLIHIPNELRDVAVLLEPLSVVEKAYRQIQAIGQRCHWRPGRVLITGSGSISLLATLLARLRGLTVLVYSRGAPHGAEAEVIRELGADYIDSTQRSLADAVRAFGAPPPDIAIEATGYSPFAWEVAGVLRTNGIACLLSVTGGNRTAQLPVDVLNKYLVLGNRLVFGSVNAHRKDFERGVEDIQQAQARWPGLMRRFITRRLPLDRFQEVLDGHPEGDIKTVLELTAS